MTVPWLQLLRYPLFHHASAAAAAPPPQHHLQHLQHLQHLPHQQPTHQWQKATGVTSLVTVDANGVCDTHCWDWDGYVYVFIIAMVLLALFVVYLPIQTYRLIKRNIPIGSPEDPDKRFDEDGIEQKYTDDMFLYDVTHDPVQLACPFQFLYKGYDRKWCYYKVIVMVIKLLLCLPVIFLSNYPVPQTLLTLVLLAAFSGLSFYASPFVSPRVAHCALHSPTRAHVCAITPHRLTTPRPRTSHTHSELLFQSDKMDTSGRVTAFMTVLFGFISSRKPGSCCCNTITNTKSCSQGVSPVPLVSAWPHLQPASCLEPRPSWQSSSTPAMPSTCLSWPSWSSWASRR